MHAFEALLARPEPHVRPLNDPSNPPLWLTRLTHAFLDIPRSVYATWVRVFSAKHRKISKEKKFIESFDVLELALDHSRTMEAPPHSPSQESRAHRAENTHRNNAQRVPSREKHE